MLTIKYQTTFKKDYKRIVKRGYDIRLLEEVITILAEQKPLPGKLSRSQPVWQLCRLQGVPYHPRLASNL